MSSKMAVNGFEPVPTPTDTFLDNS